MSRRVRRSRSMFFFFSVPVGMVRELRGGNGEGISGHFNVGG